MIISLGFHSPGLFICPKTPINRKYSPVKQRKEVINVMPMLDYIGEATKHLTEDELAEFSLRFSKRKKKEYIAERLWCYGLFGVLGLHRIYLGHYGTALILFAITVFTCGLGALAAIYDFKNIDRIVLDANKELTLEIVKEVKFRNGVWK